MTYRPSNIHERLMILVKWHLTEKFCSPKLVLLLGTLWNPRIIMVVKDYKGRTLTWCCQVHCWYDITVSLQNTSEILSVTSAIDRIHPYILQSVFLMDLEIGTYVQLCFSYENSYVRVAHQQQQTTLSILLLDEATTTPEKFCSFLSTTPNIW